MSKTRLFLLAPTVVFQAQANQPAFSFPLAEVTFDNVVVGSSAAVTAERLVVFGTTQGADDLGRQRIRKTATSDTIYFGRSSPGTRDGEVYPIDDCWITVYDIRMPFAKIPFINGNGEIFKDHDKAWNGETGDDMPPKARAGADMAGTIDSGTSKLRVQLPGVANTSYATADGASISSYAWSLPSGVALVGGYALTDAVIQVDCDPGFYQVRLEVTDSNGNTHAAWVKVYARDPANDTTIGNFQIERRTRGKDGQTLALRILEDIPADTYIDGTVIMLWEGEPASVTDRSHMRFTGFHHTDPATIQAGRTGILRDVVFECLDIAGKLKTLPGFPLTVENKTTPTSWLHMKTANMDKYIDCILRWHSNAFELADFLPSGTGSDYPFVVLGSDAQSLWDQAARRANALVPDYHLVCNVRGQLSVKVDPILQQEADRTSAVQATLVEADWSDIRYTHQRPPRVHWLRSEAILASATQIAALFTVAPDTTPGQGAVEQTHGEQLAKTHVDLMNAEGHRYARLNAQQSHFVITLAEGDEQSIEPAAMTWVKLTISAATAAQRNLNFTEARGLVHLVDMRYQHGRTGTVKTVTLTWERETTGTPAAPYFPPDTEFPPDWEPDPDGGYEPEPAPTGAGDGFGTNYGVVDSTIARTRDLSALSPAWVDISPTDANPFMDFILDSHAPASTGYLISDTGVWKSTNLDIASSTWSTVLSAASMQSGVSGSDLSNVLHILASINVENYVAVFYQSTVGGLKKVCCARSTNGGSSWSFSTTGFASGRLQWSGAVDYVPHLVGSAVRIYMACAEPNAANTAQTPYMFRSDDSGATWANVGQIATPISSGHFPQPISVHVPYHNNPTGATVYAALEGAGHHGLYKSTDSGATWARVEGGSNIEGVVHRFSAETYTQDSQKGFWWAKNRVGGAVSLYITDDAFSSTYTATKSGLIGTPGGSGGFPYQSAQFYTITTSGIFVSTDRGENFVDKTGDWAFGFTNPRVVVPLWIAE